MCPTSKGLGIWGLFMIVILFAYLAVIHVLLLIVDFRLRSAQSSREAAFLRLALQS